MKELSLHILDVAENGITAGGNLIHIRIIEARCENRLKIIIKDNGKGIAPAEIDKVTDPFVTSRTTRRVGLGLSLFKAAALQCKGHFSIKSKPGKGTAVTADFQYDHIDRAPVGDMASTVMTLIAGNPGIDFYYDHVINGKEFTFDTREIRKALEGVPLSDPAVIQHLTQSIREALAEMDLKDRNNQ